MTNFGANNSRKMPFALVFLHCLTLNYPSTKDASFLTDCLILYSPGMNKPYLVIVFIVGGNHLDVDELTLDLSILLVPKQ